MRVFFFFFFFFGATFIHSFVFKYLILVILYTLLLFLKTPREIKVTGLTFNNSSLVFDFHNSPRNPSTASSWLSDDAATGAGTD